MCAKTGTTETIQEGVCCQEMETVWAFMRDHPGFMSDCLDPWVL